MTDNEIPLSPEEAASLAAMYKEQQLDPNLTVAEHAYLAAELIRLRRVYRDLVINKLMAINQAAQELRGEDEIEIAAGRLAESFLGVHDALSNAIAETAAFVTNLSDNPAREFTKQDLLAFLTKRGEQTFDLNEYEGYRLLANRFRD